MGGRARFVERYIFRVSADFCLGFNGVGAAFLAGFWSFGIAGALTASAPLARTIGHRRGGRKAVRVVRL